MEYTQHLRPYQQKALDEVRRVYSTGKRKVLLQAPTGSGKTVIFCSVIKASAEKNKNCLMVVRGRALVDQASKRLDRENVEHGVIMAGHWRKRPHALVQVCSINTLHKRKQLPKADIIIIDEAHQATSKSYHWLTENYPNAYFLAVTATPFCNKSLEHIAQKIVRPITIKDLVNQSFLVPPKYYAPTIPNLSGVRTKQGDYDIEQLDELLNKSHPIGDVVQNWIKFSEQRPTLIFAVSVSHSKHIVSAFNAAGIKAEHLDGSSTDSERDEAIKRLQNGDIKIISNCGVLCTGVDIPFLSCVVSVRPTKSYSLYIQQMGRGTRTWPGKRDFIIIDHSGNVLRHGCILEERKGSLEPIPKQTKNDPRPNITQCKSCYAIYSLSANECPSCGAINENSPANRKEEKAKNPLEGDLTEADAMHLKIVARLGELKERRKRKNYKRGWIYHQIKREFGEETANKYCKVTVVPDWVLRQNIKR